MNLASKKVLLFFFVIVVIAFGGFLLLKKYNKGEGGSINNLNKATPSTDVVTEQQILERQREIRDDYLVIINKNISKLKSIDSVEDFKFEAENMFFDYHVPTELRDTHIQALYYVKNVDYADFAKAKEDVIKKYEELLQEAKDLNL